MNAGVQTKINPTDIHCMDKNVPQKCVKKKKKKAIPVTEFSILDEVCI